MQQKKGGLREMVGEENWEELVKIGHSIIPNDFMDFWSRFLPENCYFAYLEVCQGVIRSLSSEQLLKTLKKKKICKDEYIDSEVEDIFNNNGLSIPQNPQQILDVLEKLQLIQKYLTPDQHESYDICFPIPTPDEVLNWLPDDDLDFIQMLKSQVRECHHD